MINDKGLIMVQASLRVTLNEIDHIHARNCCQQQVGCDEHCTYTALPRQFLVKLA